MSALDRPVVFECEGERLVGILSLPDGHGATGVIVVVGGPQYRVGSHRQFRHLARRLAEQGVPVLRFDYRGMGDSEGAARSFEAVHADIGAAVSCLCREAPGVRHVVLWGLCDGASASLLGAAVDGRIRGLVLLNPWVRTDASRAATYLRHYYLRRLASREFWRSLTRGEIGVGKAVGRLLANVRTAAAVQDEGGAPTTTREAPVRGSLPERMARAFEGFRGPVALVLSGDDLTAREFADLCSAAPAWRRLVQRRGVERRELAGANHTFSRREWREQVAAWTVEWIEKWRVEFS